MLALTRQGKSLASQSLDKEWLWATHAHSHIYTHRQHRNSNDKRTAQQHQQQQQQQFFMAASPGYTPTKPMGQQGNASNQTQTQKKLMKSKVSKT